MALHRLRSLAIAVPAAEATRAFYRDFGLDETAEGRFETTDGGEQLEIVPARTRRLLALSVGADDADDLARAEASLARLGIDVETGKDWLRAIEPALGACVELRVEPRIAQKPVATLPANGPGRSGRIDSRSPAALPAPPGRPRRLSHVVVGSPDAAVTTRFLVEGIGFRLTEEVPAIASSFLRCSEDHHNVLVQHAPIAFLHHSAWEMDDVDAVGRAAASMLAADPSRHLWGLGRHGIGSNFFWYLRDPAGNFAEYTSDLDVIADEEAWHVAASTPAHPLAVWGPPVPYEFIAPADVAAAARGETVG
jgi:catechol 2,3-dioxygenase-like lactoylglutathione lyase family enzyme